MKIGIQGLEGSFHHQAALQFFNQQIEIAPFDNFHQVFEALSHGQIDRAVVAIENSLYGSINDTYDLLLQHNAWIIGEVYIHVSLQLLGIEGATIDTITDIYSQAPALAESKLYLREHVPVATQHEYPDTAMSARYIAKQGNPSKAAIASKAAADLYNLEVLAESIEDHQHNYTRFVVLTKDRMNAIDANKSSIVIQTSHTPGSLYQALNAFNEQSVNLTKIESRPIVNHESWNYIFYIDFEAALVSDEAKAVLASLESSGIATTVLGSYAKGSLPNGIR
jgi:chorismate mutase/prephenate dehydratase